MRPPLRAITSEELDRLAFNIHARLGKLYPTTRLSDLTFSLEDVSEPEVPYFYIDWRAPDGQTIRRQIIYSVLLDSRTGRFTGYEWTSVQTTKILVREYQEAIGARS